MEKKKIYCIVGDENMGKSSLIRALTGVRIGEPTRITFKSTNLTRDFWVEMVSLQEEHKEEHKKEKHKSLSIKEAIELIKDKTESYFIIPLRFGSSKNSFSSAEEYLQAFLDKDGWIIENIVILGEDTFSNEALKSKLNVITRIPQPFENTINKNASIIREAWNFL